MISDLFFLRGLHETGDALGLLENVGGDLRVYVDLSTE